jgi:hypothetical protein
MLVDLLHNRDLQLPVPGDLVDPAIRAAEANRTVAAPNSVKRLVVITRNPANLLESFMFDGVDPSQKLPDDMIRKAL